MKLICITKYPEIEISGIGKFKKNQEYEFSAKIAKRLLKSNEWTLAEKPIRLISKKSIEFKKIKSKFKKKEVKNG